MYYFVLMLTLDQNTWMPMDIIEITCSETPTSAALFSNSISVFQQNMFVHQLWSGVEVFPLGFTVVCWLDGLNLSFNCV